MCIRLFGALTLLFDAYAEAVSLLFVYLSIIYIYSKARRFPVQCTVIWASGQGLTIVVRLMGPQCHGYVKVTSRSDTLKLEPYLGPFASTTFR